MAIFQNSRIVPIEQRRHSISRNHQFGHSKIPTSFNENVHIYFSLSLSPSSNFTVSWQLLSCPTYFHIVVVYLHCSTFSLPCLSTKCGKEKWTYLFQPQLHEKEHKNVLQSKRELIWQLHNITKPDWCDKMQKSRFSYSL